MTDADTTETVSTMVTRLLTEQLASYHAITYGQPVAKVNRIFDIGGWTEAFEALDGDTAGEITDAILPAIRARIAGEIKSQMSRRPPIGATAADAWANATDRAERIARGATS